MSAQSMGFSVANTAEVLWVAMVATKNLKGKSCCFFLVLLLCPQEEVPANGIPLATSSGILAFRDVAHSWGPGMKHMQNYHSVWVLAHRCTYCDSGIGV